MAETLQNNVEETGYWDGDMVKVLKNLRDVVNELQTDHATTKTAVDLLTHRANNYVLGETSPVLAIDTNFDVKNTETIVFVAEGVKYTLGDNTSFDTGTTKTITGSQWGAFIVEAATASTGSVQWAASSYASEALALAAAKALTPTASKCTIGVVTVQAHASGFTAGTDALATGTGGNVAAATNYYDLANSIFASGPAALTNSTAITLNKG
jgi:hypothetical protein